MTSNVIIVSTMAGVFGALTLYRIVRNFTQEKPKRKPRTDLGILMLCIMSLLNLLSHTNIEIFEFGAGSFFAVGIFAVLVMGRYELINVKDEEAAVETECAKQANSQSKSQPIHQD